VWPISPAEPSAPRHIHHQNNAASHTCAERDCRSHCEARAPHRATFSPIAAAFGIIFREQRASQADLSSIDFNATLSRLGDSHLQNHAMSLLTSPEPRSSRTDQTGVDTLLTGARSCGLHEGTDNTRGISIFGATIFELRVNLPSLSTSATRRWVRQDQRETRFRLAVPFIANSKVLSVQ